MNHLFDCCLLAFVAAMVIPSVAQSQKESATELAHTRTAFSFAIAAPYAEVFPLFGAHKERVWATGFDPQFIHPLPPHDEAGMVFTTVQEGLSRVWVNTTFDAATGHVQYVYWIADVMVALIDIHVTNSGPQETKVEVVYERTAIGPAANDLVRRMAQEDANNGPHWASRISGYLHKTAAK